MTIRRTMFSMSLFGLFLAPLYAADIPSVDEGASKYDAVTCVDELTQVCINDACLNSEAIDCEDNCRQMAKDKCASQQD